ncbi:restriction endonuclease subunit S [Pseudoxanthomonas sp. SGT-18]|uniref:restriction endonuclease subunit S n=1 Tax=Pseudoxanthomonas sp. SGT-18 TaxID=2493087 RepID=UPI00197E6A7B|nr:restriction endonuclease subunit S [Pseudoxanthomonas sp. SGT-18]
MTEAKKMTQKQKSAFTPKLRFPEFQNDSAWMPVTLRDVSVPVEEKVGDRKLTPVSISAGIGFVPQAEKFGRDISGNQYKQYTVVRDGDFVYNKGNSLRFPQGCIYQLRGWGEVAAPNVFICFRLKEGYSDGFFQSCFEKNIHGIQLQRHITSGARSNGLLNISRDTFFDIKIPTPSLAEQQKIAECLSTLDELIEAESQKLDALKDHKKGLMQQLFPREDETRPRLRFPEFQDAPEWENKKIGDICRSFSGGTPDTSRKEFYGGTIPFIRSAELGKRSTELSLTELGLKNSAAKLVAKGDVLVALYGANSGDIAIAQLDGAINQAILCLRPYEDDGPFIYHYLSHKKDWLVATYIQGGQGNLSGEIVKSIELRFPEPVEQHRIATCLSSLDNLIAAQSDKLEALRTHKRGLMQQLFPNPSEFES